MASVRCFRGAEDTTSVNIDLSAKASDVRKTLSSMGFLPADSAGAAWRFFIYSATQNNVRDAVLGLDIEPLVPISGLAGPGNQLYLTNTKARTHPDLMGVSVPWFTDRKMACNVVLNTWDASAQQSNHGKFQPLMLTKVRSLSDNAVGIYDNVVVCQKGSSLAFHIRSWGSVGFAYRLTPQAGQPIVDSLYITYGDSPNREGSALIYRYENSSQQILAQSTASLGISGGKTVAYQRIEARSWDLKGYEQGGKHYGVRPPAPKPPIPGVIGDVIGGVLGGGVFGGFGHLFAKNIAASSGIGLPQTISTVAPASKIVVPGGGIDPGSTTPGGSSGQGFGSISVTAQDDPTTQPLGVVLMYLFVFDNAASAAQAIQGVNAKIP